MINQQNIINNILGNSQIMSNPVVKNAYDLMQKGNTQALQELAQNIAKEKGIDLNQLIQNLMH